MPKKSKRPTFKINWNPVVWLKFIFSYAWHGSLWRKILTVLIAIIIFITGVFYGIAEWYIHKHNSQPLVIGTSFVGDYAKSFGLDPKQTLGAILSDLKVKQIRLVSYWKEIEPTPGKYDFSNLDWQFDLANKYGTKVSLAVGMRQPRWPECHEPSWISVDTNNKQAWQPQLFKYMEAVVDRYKDNPALQDYELENEFFMAVFGECKDFDRARLVSEFKMVKQWDPNHPVIISRSNNWVGIPIGEPTPDVFAVSVYKRVWDNFITKRYFEYPLPPWFYAALAGSEELLSGKDMIIHELQAEPWGPNFKKITEIPVAEQFKSMDADRLKKRIEYGKDTGMRTVDLWGAEWWYWLKEKGHDSSVWDVVKQAVQQAEQENQLLK
ncbi:beta-galactosidase [Candidatus Saccharibacteria bacterium]|nr:beta-galactosidase [Candidatus Saccharibacteria bacterium]